MSRASPAATGSRNLGGQVVVLTGPPGAGKTTLSKLLVARGGTPGVHLHADDFWHFIRFGGIAPYLPAAREQNGVVMTALAGSAQAYAQGGYFVVLDGIVGPWFLDIFRSVAAPLHYVVMRPRLEDALTRCRSRGGDALADSGPIGELHRQFLSLGPLEPHAIETAGLTLEETLRAVESAVHGGRYRLDAG